uniref:WD repeat and HMG-box DNA-binding protein 1 n=1 Tax=Timema poppense TaxID=170557 RepID=A0A7R9CMT7_TIMPO|nr:unnamed protein product [Timema poppensis]
MSAGRTFHWDQELSSHGVELNVFSDPIPERVWNSVGIVRCSNVPEDVIDVEFHDTSVHHALYIKNYMHHHIASLTQHALVLACEAEDGPSKLVCVLLNCWDGTREWQVDLPEGEGALCVALGEGWLAAATDTRMLRIWTLCGSQREVVALPGPVLCLAGHKHKLIVVCHVGIGAAGDQNVSYCVMNLIQGQMSPWQPLPLTPGSNVQWIGFSDEGTPFMMDSTGSVRMLSSKGFWLPVLDTKTHEVALRVSHSSLMSSDRMKPRSGDWAVKGKSDHYFILGVSEKFQNIRAVLCKGSHYPPTTPRPPVVEIPLQVGLGDVTTERGQLEEIFWRSTLTGPSIPDPTDLEKAAKEAIIKLFALACRSDQQARAVELCSLMQGPQVVQLAMKYASKLGKSHLADRIADMDFSHLDAQQRRYRANTMCKVVVAAQNKPAHRDISRRPSPSLLGALRLVFPKRVNEYDRQPTHFQNNQQNGYNYNDSYNNYVSPNQSCNESQNLTQDEKVHSSPGIRKVIFLGNVPTFVWRKCGNPFWETTLSTPDQESNLDLPVIGNLVYCERSTLDHGVIEAEKENILITAKRKAQQENEGINNIRPAPVLGLSQSQKKLNPFKKCAGKSEVGRGLANLASSANKIKVNSSNGQFKISLNSSAQRKRPDNNHKQSKITELTKSESSPSSKEQEIKKVDNPITFVEWFSQEKTALQEEFPNLGPAELTKQGMKRFKEIRNNLSPQVPDIIASNDTDTAEEDSKKRKTMNCETEAQTNIHELEAPKKKTNVSLKLSSFMFKKTE